MLPFLPNSSTPQPAPKNMRLFLLCSPWWNCNEKCTDCSDFFCALLFSILTFSFSFGKKTFPPEMVSRNFFFAAHESADVAIFRYFPSFFFSLLHTTFWTFSRQKTFHSAKKESEEKSSASFKSGFFFNCAKSKFIDRPINFYSFFSFKCIVINRMLWLSIFKFI